MTPKQFAKLRAQIGLSQEKIAKRIGVHWRTVNRWEKGEYKISPDRVADIKRVARESGVRA